MALLLRHPIPFSRLFLGLAVLSLLFGLYGLAAVVSTATTLTTVSTVVPMMEAFGWDQAEDEVRRLAVEVGVFVLLPTFVMGWLFFTCGRLLRRVADLAGQVNRPRPAEQQAP
jgi:hypothetical protein